MLLLQSAVLDCLASDRAMYFYGGCMGICYFAEFVVGQQTNVGALLVLRAVGYFLVLATCLRGICTGFDVVAGAERYCFARDYEIKGCSNL